MKVWLWWPRKEEFGLDLEFIEKLQKNFKPERDMDRSTLEQITLAIGDRISWEGM